MIEINVEIPEREIIQATAEIDEREISVATIKTKTVIDQTFDGTSPNAQSGVAIETVFTNGSYSPTFDTVYFGEENYGSIYNNLDSEYDANATTITAGESALRVINNVGAFFNQYQLLTTDNTFYDGSSFSLSGTTLNYNTSSTHNISLFSDSESHISAYGLNGHYEFAVFPEALSLTNYNTSGNILGNCSLTVDTNNKLNANGGVVATLNDIPSTINAANIDLSNLSATGEKVLYSGYVHSVKDLEATAVNYPTSADKSYDLTQYLPNDTSNYFVLMRFECTTGATSGDQTGMQVHSDLEAYTINLARTRTRASSSVNCGGSGYIPIGTGRTLYINHNANFTGTFTAALLGYIRIGTNT